MVPIRDMETHEQLKGIEIGDIGPKLGFATKDNGYLSFDHVKIPSSYLLSRYTEVKDGKYVTHGDSKV